MIACFHPGSLASQLTLMLLPDIDRASYVGQCFVTLKYLQGVSWEGKGLFGFAVKRVQFRLGQPCNCVEAAHSSVQEW